MKTSLLRVTTAFAILIALLGVATGPVSAKNDAKSVTLMGVSFIPNKGYIFKFKTTGSFNTKDLQGYVKIGNDRHNLNCSYADAGHLTCSPTDSLVRYIGRSASGAVGGFSFDAVIPAKLYCLSIYDYDMDDVWGKIGRYCKTNANFSSTIVFYNPDYGRNYTYYYYKDGSDVECSYPPAPSWGPAYYFDDPDYC